MWGYSIVIAITLAVSSPSLVSAKDKIDSDVSWGKAGVTFDDYRADAQECARLGANSDITGTEAAKTIIRGIDRQDTDLLEGVNPYTAREYVFTGKRSRFKENVDKAQLNMMNVVRQCLLQKGYIMFVMNKNQQSKLSNLKYGSNERFRYMHSLASDKEVLNSQKFVVD